MHLEYGRWVALTYGKISCTVWMDGESSFLRPVRIYYMRHCMLCWSDFRHIDASCCEQAHLVASKRGGQVANTCNELMIRASRGSLRSA